MQMLEIRSVHRDQEAFHSSLDQEFPFPAATQELDKNPLIVLDILNHDERCKVFANNFAN